MYTCWIILVAISLFVSLIAFVWALRSGQFSDQGRARYLPLSDDSTLLQVRPPSKRTKEAYVLLCIIILGSLGIVGSVILSLWRSTG